MSRMLGLDLGEKRIGMAVSDELGLTAQGLETLHRKEKITDIERLNKIIQNHNVQKIVVGLPRNMDGTYGKQAESTKEFAGLLKENSGVEIVFWDERMTSISANKVLIEANISRKKRKGTTDRLAAVIILQGYLDSLRH